MADPDHFVREVKQALSHELRYRIPLLGAFAWTRVALVNPIRVLRRAVLCAIQGKRPVMKIQSRRSLNGRRVRSLSCAGRLPTDRTWCDRVFRARTIEMGEERRVKT